MAETIPPVHCNLYPLPGNRQTGWWRILSGVIAVRTFIPLIIILILAARMSPAQEGIGREQILAKCPTLARLTDSGQIEQVRDPAFTDAASARKFAQDCRKVVHELNAMVILPPDLERIKAQAEMAAEFLMGDVYDLTTSKVPAIVKLRTWVKIPPPRSLVYVKKYSPKDQVPEQVAQAFGSLSNREDRARVQGVTMNGRYIALLEVEFHDELADNLGHELVHAYITLASPEDLPKWFQEGAAVYFSTGRGSKLYGATGNPVMKQVTLPDDYKSRLYSFQYIENTVGRKKLFEFVRKSVETGKPDPRSALGMGKPPEPFKPPIAQIVLVVLGVALAFGAAWYISHRREQFD